MRCLGDAGVRARRPPSHAGGAVRIDLVQARASRMGQGEVGVRRDGGVESFRRTWLGREHQVDAVAIGCGGFG